MRNRIHVLPDFGYDTINVSSGNTVRLFPARSRPSTYFRAYPSCLIMSRSNFTPRRTPKLIHRGPVEIPAPDLSDAGQRDEGGSTVSVSSSEDADGTEMRPCSAR